MSGRGFLLLVTGLAGRFIHRIAAGDKTLHQRAGEAVLAEPAGRFTTAIKPGDDLTRAVDDLAFGVDAEPRAGVVRSRGRPCGVVWWFRDFVSWSGFPEIGVDA